MYYNTIINLYTMYVFSFMSHILSENMDFLTLLQNQSGLGPELSCLITIRFRVPRLGTSIGKVSVFPFSKLFRALSSLFSTVSPDEKIIGKQ